MGLCVASALCVWCVCGRDGGWGGSSSGQIGGTSELVMVSDAPDLQEGRSFGHCILWGWGVSGLNRLLPDPS